MHQTRFEVNGVRYYRTGDRPERAYPSVTAILSEVASEKSKKTLQQWAINNPGGREAAAKRGTAIHEGCEHYLRGKTPAIPEEYMPFWNGMDQHLDQYDEVYWSERPLRPEWGHCTGPDKISRVWSHAYGYCGCPDLVGKRRNLVTLADYKTSNMPYCRYYPDKSRERWRFGGWQKFIKCAKQLGAYAIGIEESIGLRIDAAQIIVSTPETTQSFIILPHELEHYKFKWRQVKHCYDQKMAELGKATFLDLPGPALAA